MSRSGDNAGVGKRIRLSLLRQAGRCSVGSIQDQWERLRRVVMVSIRRRLGFFAAWSALLALFLTTGCIWRGWRNQEHADKRVAESRAKSAQLLKQSLGGQRQISVQELDQLIYAYADRYYMVISSAVGAIKRGNPDPIQRRIAHQIGLNGVSAMNDIVSSNDPYSKVLDLVSSVTLQSRLVIDENRAEQVFGDQAPGLIKAVQTMRAEAWDLAAKVLTQDQLELLDYLILEWRRKHPGVEQVAYVKFDNFAGARAAGLLHELRSGGGFLAPVREATQELADMRRLTERIFWYSKRAPNIAAIEAEAAVNEILATPEITSTLQTGERLVKTVESTPQLIDAQRKAFFAELDARQTLLTNTLGDLRQIVARGDALVRSLPLLATNVQQTLGVVENTLTVADSVGQHLGMGRPSTNPAARPFNIQDYTIALARLNEAVTNLHQLSLSADQFTQTEGWKKALRDIGQVSDQRVDRVFLRLCWLLGLAFVLAVAYRVISVKLTRRIAPPGQHNP